MSRLVPDKSALHSGRIGGATRLAAMGSSPLVIKREGRWWSNASTVHVRANMEDPAMDAGSLVERERKQETARTWN